MPGVGLPPFATERLAVRPWQDSDREPFAALSADPEVMRFFPAPLCREESVAAADRLQAAIERDGYGLWAIEVRRTGEFVGYTGLNAPTWDAPFTPCVEVGWRLARSAWGHGYATEAARAALLVAFEDLGLAEVVSFTVPANVRSRAVMERLGMSHDPAHDFEHPLLPPGHALRRHVLYRLRRSEWARQIVAPA